MEVDKDTLSPVHNVLATLQRIADEISALKLHPTTSEDAHAEPQGTGTWHEFEQLRDRAETAVVAANALQARLNAVEVALREQVDACDADDCGMCHRHRSLLAKPEGSANG